MPKIYIIGMGVGHLDYLAPRATQIIRKSDLVLGATRLIESAKEINQKAYPCQTSKVIEMILENQEAKHIAILVSGDVGFYSLAKTLREKLKDLYEIEQITGISSMQYFLNRLGRSYENICTVSMHGRDGNLLGKVRNHTEVFVLTGGCYPVKTICQLLCEEGMENVKVMIGEKLSYAEEKIHEGLAKEFIDYNADELSVMLIENMDVNHNNSYSAPGISDDAFIRGKVPMTKSEIRAVSLSKLQVGKTDIVYDIGAGTGSVAIEMALCAKEGFVYALEKKSEAVALIQENIAHFKLHNIKVVETECPMNMETLPPPDAVFIGGSSGALEAILETILHKNPNVRIVINAITLETLTEALKCFEKYQLINQDIVQISAANSKTLGHYHMMLGQNPIFILSAQGGKQ
ncbi:MAG: precorrin-6y C5,15-methyltransferase (decarboxylating) subunit CbiE [Cellulosilyticaceae bacterium]